MKLHLTQRELDKMIAGAKGGCDEGDVEVVQRDGTWFFVAERKHFDRSIEIVVDK